MATEYLFAVQDQNGREVIAVKAEVDKVGDISAAIQDDKLNILYRGDVIGTATDLPEGPLMLHRWKVKDKLAEPVSKSVKRIDDSKEASE